VLYIVADNRWHLMPQVDGTQGGRQFFDMAVVPWWRDLNQAGNEEVKPTSHGLAVFAGAQCNPKCNLVGSLAVYSLEQHRWSTVSVEDEPLGKYHSSTVFLQDALWTFGGESYTPHMYHNSVQRMPWPPPRGAIVITYKDTVEL